MRTDYKRINFSTWATGCPTILRKRSTKRTNKKNRWISENSPAIRDFFFFVNWPLSERRDGWAFYDSTSAERAILYVSQRFNLTATERTDGRTPSWSCPSRLDLIESRTVLPEGRTLLHLMGTSSRSHIKQRARVAYSLLDCDIGIDVRISGSTPGTTTEEKTMATPNLTREKVGREFTFECLRRNVSALFAADQYVYFMDSGLVKKEETDAQRERKGWARSGERSP